MLANREATTETIAKGLVEMLYNNSKLAYEVAAGYDELVQGSLKDLQLPRIDIQSVARRFPDVLADGNTSDA